MNILTFDIEDWYHILANDSTKSISNWSNFETRIHMNMDKIFEILDESNHKATFFILGWIAHKHPDIVKKIHKYGHEIATHSYSHQLVFEQNKDSFRLDIEKSIKLLQDLTGEMIVSFRAPGFSITEKTKWAFEVLYELGITHDCSIFPTKRAHGGYKDYPFCEPSKIIYEGATIKEFPINKTQMLFKDVVFSGGGYFRILPYSFIKKQSKKSTYIMSYFHPRDFDSDQPIIKNLSPLRKFKSYVGIKGCLKKTKTWLNDFNFIDLRTASNLIDWEKAPIVKL